MIVVFLQVSRLTGCRVAHADLARSEANAGILYGRLPRSTPPIVVRAATADELAAKVAEAEAQR